MPFYQVRFNWAVNGQSYKNVTNWDIAGGTPADIQATADGIRAAVVTHIQSKLSNLASLVDLTLRPFDGGGVFSFDQDFTLGPVTGSSANDLYDQTSPLLVSYSAMAGPPNRGRFNIPGMTEGDWSSDGWDNSALSAAGDFVDELAQGIVIPGGTSRLKIARPDFLTNTIAASNDISTIVPRKYSRKLTSRRPS